MIIMINGKFVPKAKANIPVWSSFGRGYGIFETLRTYKNKIIQLSDHLNRLYNSAKKIDLKINYNKKNIASFTEKVMKKSAHQDQRIKIMAIENYLIIISEKLIIDKKIYKGVKCMSIELERPLPEVKSISYLTSYLSNERATKKGFYDAILVDRNGHVTEGAYSNIFWFEGSTLYTRDDNILPGTIRSTILKISPYKTKFKKIKIQDLKKKQEVFLTTSLKGIIPITKIDSTNIGNSKPGKKTKLLMEALSSYLFDNNH